MVLLGHGGLTMTTIGSGAPANNGEVRNEH
jgi:hypothetical protein